MRRSKLEGYIDILYVLALNGQLRITDLIDKSKVNSKVMIEQLEFLLKSSLVEEKLIGKERTAFIITAKGINVLKFFGKIEHIVPVEEEKKRMLLS
jgi:predicted transcriptional regulator